MLKYISSMDTENVQHLSQKLATLLAILCGQRAQEILSLIEIRNIAMEETSLTRSATSSTANKGRVPITTILKTGAWRSMKTFGRFYDKESVEKKDDFALIILDNLKL